MTASRPHIAIKRKQPADIRRVLIVARNPELRRLLHYIFNGKGGYAGDSVATDAEAFDLIAKNRYQFLIYDTDKFVDASSVGALVATSASPLSHRVKTVMLTSYGHFDREYGVLSGNVDLCLCKPFTQRQLLDHLSQLTNNRDA